MRKPKPVRRFVDRRPDGMLAPGRYLTDGRRLLRVISSLTGILYPSVELEDCLTLQVEHYSPGELYRMQLRPVRPSAQ